MSEDVIDRSFRVEIRSASQGKSEFILPEGKYIIGSDLESDIILFDQNIAKKHAMLGFSDNVYHIELLQNDKFSTSSDNSYTPNNTYLYGDTATIGNTLITIHSLAQNRDADSTEDTQEDTEFPVSETRKNISSISIRQDNGESNKKKTSSDNKKKEIHIIHRLFPRLQHISIARIIFEVSSLLIIILAIFPRLGENELISQKIEDAKREKINENKIRYILDQAGVKEYDLQDKGGYFVVKGYIGTVAEKNALIGTLRARAIPLRINPIYVDESIRTSLQTSLDRYGELLQIKSVKNANLVLTGSVRTQEEYDDIIPAITMDLPMIRNISISDVLVLTSDLFKINEDTNPETQNHDTVLINIKELWAGDNPYIITQQGNKYYQGDKLEDGTVIISIRANLLTIQTPQGRLHKININIQ